jgi:DNA-binding transcriptional LysR family regulator
LHKDSEFVSRDNLAHVNLLSKSGQSINYPRKSIELQNLEVVKWTVVEGYGITVLPEIAVRREMYVGLLKCIDLNGFNFLFKAWDCL